MLSVLHNIRRSYTKTLTILCLFLACFWGGKYYGFNSANLQWQKRWLARDLLDTTRLAQSEKKQRETELRRQHIIEEEKNHAEKELVLAKENAAAADRAAGRLQQQLRILRQQLAGSETRKLSEIAGLRQTESETTILLAELLQETDIEAGNYASQADEAYLAGKQCEVIYDRIVSD